MKKLLSVLLVLALLLPAAAMAEQEVDLGFGVLRLDDNAYVTLGDRESGILVQVIPDPYAEVLFYDNFNVMWSDAQISDIDMEPEAFAKYVMSVAKAGMEAQGVTASNETVLSAEIDKENDMLTLEYTMDVDYSGLGIDMQLTLYFGQLAFSFEGDGMYAITFTASSEDGILALLDYVDTALVFKE